jgi:hypothetical protein
MLSPSARESGAILASSGIGAGAFAGLSAMDAQGQLGPAPVPQLGGFGTWTGLISLLVGIPTVGLGVAGAVGKGPLKRAPNAAAGSTALGTILLAGQAVSTAVNAPSVTTPAVLARRAGTNMAARAAAGPARAGFLLPPGVVPTAPSAPTGNQQVANLLSG